MTIQADQASTDITEVFLEFYEFNHNLLFERPANTTRKPWQHDNA